MSKEILTEIGNTLMRGVEFHSRMVDYYSFLSLKCFRDFQCCQLSEELENYHNFVNYVCDRHKILLKYTYTPLPEIIPNDFYGKSMLEVDENSTVAFLKASMKNYLDWEKGTKNKLEESAKQLLDHHCHSDYQYVSCLIDDVLAEIYHIESLMLDLKIVSYEHERVPHLYQKLGLTKS